MTDSTIHTHGGTGITGDVEAGTFIGRDQIVVLSGYTGADLERVLATLREILAQEQAVLRADVSRGRLRVTAPDAVPVTLSAAAADALAGTAAHAGDVAAYLTALQVNSRYGRWATRFVPLAGTLTAREVPPGWTDVPPEFTLLQVEGEGAQRQIRRIPLDDITEVTDRYDRLVLLGEPGSGKTTTLYKLALDAARERLISEAGKIPLTLPLADYRGYTSPYDFVAARWHQHVGREDLGDYLRAGQLLLLCDALNEMPFRDARDYRAQVETWRRFVAAWPGNRVLFTCRSRDYSEPLGLHQVEIKPFDDERVHEFLVKYVPEHAATAWQRLAASPLLDLVRNPYYLQMLAYLIEQGAAWPERLAHLFAGFVQTLVGREERRNHADWMGGEKLITALEALAETMQAQGQGTRLPRDEAASHIPEELTATPSVLIRLGLAATILDTEWGTNAAGQAVEQVRFYHHQLQEYFAARALVRRFCAQEDLGEHWYQPRLKKDMPDPGALSDDEPLPPPPTTGWEEPTILAAGLAPRPADFVDAVRRVNPVLAARCLDEGRLDLPDVAENVRADLLQEMHDEHVHLRARIASGEVLGQIGDPRFNVMHVGDHRVLLPPLVEVPGGTFTMGSSFWHVIRLRLSGFTAAENETPQHRVDVLPFYIGCYPVTNAEYGAFIAAGGYADETYWPTPAARGWLQGEVSSAFVDQWMEAWQIIQANPEKVLAQLKRSGVTPQQLDGFEQLAQMDEEQVRDLFTEAQAEGPRDRPAYWDDTRYNHPAQPVVGVTWFEALAYCAWLEAQLKRAAVPLQVWEDGKLSTRDFRPGTFKVELPTEAQWECAARGMTRRIYPWGRRWAEDRANTWEGHVLRSTPVGVYPRGVNALGVHDAAGNVWEWTRSLYRPYPYVPTDGREDLQREGYRVVRGGSWGNYGRHARCAYRGRTNPDDFGDTLGVRVVVSLVCSEC